jgi:hypothetical protein
LTERLWQMTRLGAGDYLLPSNDRQTLWRIRKYQERDGTLTRGDGSVVNGDFWSLHGWKHTTPPAEYQFDEYERLTDWHNWAEVACMMPTRKACIDYALELDERQLVASLPGS